MKKRIVIPLVLLYLMYFIALIYQNDIIGDILSPILTMFSVIPVFYGFYWKENKKVLKISGLFFSLSIFTWFLCDFLWGVSSIILKIDPESSIVITYGYSLTNLLLVMSLMLSGYFQVKTWNRMQILLDTLMVTISSMVLVWVFIFEQDTKRTAVLLTDPVSMFSLITDFMIYAWTNVWFFSVRDRNAPLFVKFSAAGGVTFVITDIIYYYEYFYRSYEPNSLLDGGYVIAFTLMGIGGWFKIVEYNKIRSHETDKEQTSTIRFRKELLFLAVPLLLIILKGTQAPSLLFLVSAIMFISSLQIIRKTVYTEMKCYKKKRNM